jgi:hypothetical protein
MPVENEKNILYYSVSKNATIRSTNGTNKDTEFDSIWGVLVSIREDLKNEFEGRLYPKFEFKLEDPAHSVVEILQVGLNSSAARGLIVSLYCIPGEIKQVKITPYPKDKYTNVWVKYRDNENEEWKDLDKDRVLQMFKALPEVTVDKLTDHVEDRERLMFIRKLARKISQDKLHGMPENNNHDNKNGVPPKNEQFDPETGEVFDGRKATDDVYGEPKHEKSTPVASAEIDDHMFDDMDDDLPF